MSDFFGNDFGLYDSGGFDFGSTDWGFDFGSIDWGFDNAWWNDASFGDWYGYGGAAAEPFAPMQQDVQLYPSNTMGWSASAAGSLPSVVASQSTLTPQNIASNANPMAATASMPLHAYDDWGTGSGYRSNFTLDTLSPDQYGSQLPQSAGSSWGKRLGAMADRIVSQLPTMALSALVGKPKLPGGSAMDMLTASVGKSNAFNDRLAADYMANMPGIQQTAVQTLAQTTPQAQANEAYRGAMVSNAAQRRALERRLAASNASPDAKLAAMRQFDTGAGATSVMAYNSGLGRGLSQTMDAASRASGLFPAPNYAAVGSLAGMASNAAANRALTEFNMRQQQLSDVSGLLDGVEEGRKRGMTRQSYW